MAQTAITEADFLMSSANKDHSTTDKGKTPLLVAAGKGP